MKTVESSAVFQPKQWAENQEDDRKQDLTRTCALEHCSRCPIVFQPKQWAEKEARKTIENRT